MIVRLPPAFLRAFFLLQRPRLAICHFRPSNRSLRSETLCQTRGTIAHTPSPPPSSPGSEIRTYVRWSVPLLCLNRVFVLSFVRLSRFLRWIYGPRRRCQKCFRTPPPLPLPSPGRKSGDLQSLKRLFFSVGGNHCTLGDCVNCVSTSSPIPPSL